MLKKQIDPFATILIKNEYNLINVIILSSAASGEYGYGK